MLDRWFGHNTHYYLHLLGLTGVAAGLPLNKVVLSISTLFLLLNILLSGDFTNKFNLIKSNRIFLLILAFFSLHFVGLLWSDDLGYGLHDIWKKIPLLIIPLSCVVFPFNRSEHRDYLLLVFVASTLITSLINFLSYQQVFGEKEYIGFREMSLFGSHVRYALFIVMSFGISYYFILKKYLWPLFMVLGAWFVFYTAYSQVIAGITSFVIVIASLSFYHFYPKRKIILGAVSVFILGAGFWLIFWLFQPVDQHSIQLDSLEKYTKEGNQYTHDLSLISPESNKPIGLYTCDKELRREWNKISDLDFDGKDKKGQPLHQTLRRYLSSKDLRKDAEGMAQLKPVDIRKIEHGCASHYCQGIPARLYGLKYQILNEQNPNGHSFLQRLEYWKAGVNILSDNILIGVGTGDVQKEFDKYYDKTHSPLNEQNRLRSHNMYITVFLTFGIIGIILFLWLHTSFLRMHVAERNLVAILFIAIALTSYLTEDTLETQFGITFFAFFLGIYIYPKKS